MQRKPPLPLIIGIILSIFAIMLLNVYLTSERKTMEERIKKAISEREKSLVSVLVAANDIAPGTVIEPQLLDTKIVPSQYVEPQAATTATSLTGMKAAVKIGAGEQITLSKLITQRQAMGRSLAMATPIGKRAITITVDQITGLAGMIMPGDYVDLITIMQMPIQKTGGGVGQQLVTIPLFQNVLVLAVGDQLLEPPREDETPSQGLFSFNAPQKPKQQASRELPLVTLALTPQEASLLSFVKEQGRIQLVMRSPADAQKQQVPLAGWDSLFQYMTTILPPRPVEQKEEVVVPKQIEIYRGFNKEFIPVTE